MKGFSKYKEILDEKLKDNDPVEKSYYKIFIDAVLASTLTFLLLITFKPYLLSGLNPDVTLKVALIISFVVFVAVLTHIILIKNVTQRTWSLLVDFKSHFYFLTCLTFLFLLLSAPIFNWWLKLDFSYSIQYFFNLSFYTFTYGIFLYVLFRFGDIYNILKNEIEKSEDDILKKEKVETVFIEGKNKGEAFSLNINDFIYFTSKGHYVDVFYLENNTVEKKMIRNSFSNVLFQFEEFDFVVQSHRSFVVNLNFCESRSFKSKKGEVKLKFIENKLPVSKSCYNRFPEEVDEKALDLVRLDVN